MRVTGGDAKGARIRTLKGPETRPTADQVRKAIFDILGPVATDSVVNGARVIDLFAGSGALGIEALSRGAAEAVFVESSREACAIILENLNATGYRDKGIVRRADVERFLSRKARPAFDLAFLDPPYARGLGFVARMLGKLGSGNWIRTGGTVVVESAVGTIPWPEGFRETRVRPFGRTQIAVAVRDDDA
jgi:16S rRNA (guanine966-N2)-methyltransferase